MTSTVTNNKKLQEPNLAGMDENRLYHLLFIGKITMKEYVQKIKQLRHKSL